MGILTSAPAHLVSDRADYPGAMDWYCITCWRCSSTFMDTDPGGYCIWCAAPGGGERNGRFVQHAAAPVGPPQEPAAPALQLRQQQPSEAAARDDAGDQRICQWRLRSSTTGRVYTTRHKLSERTARGIDPGAVPVGEMRFVRGGAQASTGDFMGPERVPGRMVGYR